MNHERFAIRPANPIHRRLVGKRAASASGSCDPLVGYSRFLPHRLTRSRQTRIWCGCRHSRIVYGIQWIPFTIIRITLDVCNRNEYDSQWETCGEPVLLRMYIRINSVTSLGARRCEQMWADVLMWQCWKRKEAHHMFFAKEERMFSQINYLEIITF